MRRALLLTILLLVPVVGAYGGTVIDDPEGDATAGPDPLAVLMDVAGDGYGNLSLQLASYQDGDLGEIDVTWQATAPDGQAFGLGIRFRLLPTGVEAYALEDDGGTWDEWAFPEEVDVVPGSPGMLIARGVTLAPGRGATLEQFSFRAYASSSATPNAPVGTSSSLLRGVPVDEGTGSGEVRIPLMPAAATPWPVQGPPLVELDAGTGGVGDLRAFWLARNGTGFDATWQLATLDEAGVQECGRWAVNLFAYPRDADQSLSMSVSMTAGNRDPLRFSATTRDWVNDEIVASHEHQAQLRVVYGTPGWVQLHVPATDWHRGAIDADGLGVGADCGGERDSHAPSSPSIFSFAPGGFSPFMLIMFLPGLVAVGWFVWLQRTTKP